ncbi:unnamed protein product, partial [Polarella glacialis]
MSEELQGVCADGAAAADAISAAASAKPRSASGSGMSARTKYFKLDKESSSPDKAHGREDSEAAEESPEDAEAWAEERRQLEMSKVNFQRTVQKQNKVEQSVCSLLKRLDELPDGAELAD